MEALGELVESDSLHSLILAPRLHTGLPLLLYNK